MQIKLGIDIGGSTTKLAGVNADGEIIGVLQVRADDQVTSCYGAIGRFLSERKLTLADVSEFCLTGVGATFFGDEIYGIPVTKRNEFEAIGRGGLLLSGLKRAVVASVGTGTAFVRATETGASHLGGSGVGGGTLLGLSHLLLQEEDLGRVSELAKKGNAGNVDLLVSAITNDKISTLPDSATAANFGAVNPTTSREDLAFASVNLVTQTVCVLAVFAAKSDPDGLRDVVLTGSVTQLPAWRDTCDAVEQMTGVKFHIPEKAMFATAIGCCRLTVESGQWTVDSSRQ